MRSQSTAYCVHGHALDAANTYISPAGKHFCRACRHIANRKLCESRRLGPERRAEKALARIWALVNKDGPVPPHQPNLGPCWQWTGGADRKGYGVLCHSGRSQRSSRFFWRLLRCPIPDALCVLHHCDNRLCVNPEHLFVGTINDNNQDMIAKGRARFHSRSRLNTDQVREIRRAYAAGEASQKELARRFGVGTSVLNRAINRVYLDSGGQHHGVSLAIRPSASS